MKAVKILTASALFVSLVTSTNADVFAPVIKTDVDKVSYAIGYNIGNSFKTQDITINQSLLQSGLSDGISGKTPVMTQDDMKATLTAFQKQMMQKAQAQQQAAGAKNQAASDAYLKQVSTQPGVKMLDKGIYYKVITVGTGKMPKATDSVTVNYEGSLSDGTVFDSSYKRGQPATFQLNQVIPGWSKALQKMPVGSTWMIYLASAQGYGTYAPPQIGPNQALTFKVQLISINAVKAPSAKVAPAAAKKPVVKKTAS